MRRIPVLLFISILLSACAGKTPTVTEPAPLVPYLTPTLNITPSLLPLVTGSSLPTPTAITYIVVNGDTFIGIASRYGISPEALQAANPGILPAALPVGTTLIIPPGNATPKSSIPTPVPLQVLQPRCWPEISGGLWCFALLHNEYSETLENISAQFILMDASSGELAAQTVFGLLDTLPPGDSMPLAVHFAAAVQGGASLQVQVLTAIRLLPGDTRYLPVMIANTLVTLDSSGRAAQVTGKVSLVGSGAAKTIWVLATAYDASGDVVGVRRWESQSTLSAESPVSFDFLVSSVGRAIDQVEFVAEARP